MKQKLEIGVPNEQQPNYHMDHHMIIKYITKYESEKPVKFFFTNIGIEDFNWERFNFSSQSQLHLSNLMLHC